MARLKRTSGTWKWRPMPSTLRTPLTRRDTVPGDDTLLPLRVAPHETPKIEQNRAIVVKARAPLARRGGRR